MTESSSPLPSPQANDSVPPRRSDGATALDSDEAGRAKLHFLAVLSHDLRTPLTPVLMTIAALESDPSLPADLRPHIAMIRRNIELETYRIDDLLELLRRATLAESTSLHAGTPALVLELPRPAGSVPAPRPRRAAVVPSQGLRLLLVEDDVDTAQALERLLGLIGYRVKLANTVCRAIDFLAAEPFDILVSDLGLPDASGYELMRHIQGLYPLVAIAMSGFGMEEDIQKSRDAGFAHHLVKPISIDQLHSAIQQAHPHESPS